VFPSQCSLCLCGGVQFTISQHDLGFVDKDYGVYKNFAFCEETIIHLDMGKLEKYPAPLDADSRKEELSQINRRLAMWLQELQGT
jgi:hypothetical protein